MNPIAISTMSAAQPNTIWCHRASVQSSKLPKSNYHLCTPNALIQVRHKDYRNTNQIMSYIVHISLMPSLHGLRPCDTNSHRHIMYSVWIREPTIVSRNASHSIYHLCGSPTLWIVDYGIINHCASEPITNNESTAGYTVVN
jgi:hypothetical protein